MTYVRGQLGDRLHRQLARAWWRWRHPPVAAGLATGSCSSRHPQTAAGSRVDSGRPDTGCGSGRSGGPRTLTASRSVADRTPRRGHHPAVRTTSPGGRSSGGTSDTWQCPRRRPVPTAAVGGRAWVVSYRRPRCLCPAQGCGRVRGGQQPSGQHPASTRPHSQPRRGPCRGVRFRGHLLGSAPGRRSRRTSTVRRLGQQTRLVDTGGSRRPALRTPATAAVSCRPYGTATLDSRQQHRPPPPRCLTRNGTARSGSGQHPPCPLQPVAITRARAGGPSATLDAVRVDSRGQRQPAKGGAW
jgi:hypothetical protein